MKKPKVRKGTLLDIAELLDAYRVVPRILLFFYGYLVWYITNWYLPIQNPTTGQTAVFTTLLGSIPVIVGLYQSSGRRWGPHGNRQWRQPRIPQYQAPTIVMPPIQPNINIGQGEPPTPDAGGPAGRSAGPYDDRDYEDGGE